MGFEDGEVWHKFKFVDIIAVDDNNVDMDQQQ